MISICLIQILYVHKNFLSFAWFCCHISDQITNISSHDLIQPFLLFFEMEICINTQVFWISSGKKVSVRGTLLHGSCKLQMSFWYVAVSELKRFVFSCVVVGQQCSFNFILVSYFNFEMFRIMADIYLVGALFLFSLYLFVVLTPLHFTVSPLRSL